MVTDAAGTGFEIKKPHKGTETISILVTYGFKHLKLRNPIRGRKRFKRQTESCLNDYLKLRNPIRGRKQYYKFFSE